MIKTKTISAKYQRILLKCSGEMLMKNGEYGISPELLTNFAKDLAALVALGVEVGLVIGGGNLLRGKTLADAGLDRVTADQMGMLATVMNSLAICSKLQQINLPARVMSAIPISGFVDPVCTSHAIKCLARGEIVIFAAGTGNPLFTTDTAACLRAIEIKASVVLKATKVDGIYSEDPLKNAQAKRFEKLSYKQVLQDGLDIMDATAICLCQEHRVTLQVFDMRVPRILERIVYGELVGTIVGETDA